MSEKIGDLTGKKFGHLSVISQADPIRSEQKVKDRKGNIVLNPDGTPKIKPGKTVYRAWFCRCDCGKELTVKEDTLTKPRAYLPSCGCVKDVNPDRQGKCSPEETKQWQELYEYVRSEVMGYPSSVSLSSRMVLQLKGMRYGQYIHNKKIKANADYSYAMIKEAFEFCKSQIHKAVVSKSFVDEERKFAYLKKIAESRLNTVYRLSKKREQAQEQAQYVDMSVYENKEWNFHGTGSPLGAADRVRESEERVRQASHMYDEELDIESLW